MLSALKRQHDGNRGRRKSSTKYTYTKPLCEAVLTITWKYTQVLCCLTANFVVLCINSNLMSAKGCEYIDCFIGFDIIMMIF